MYSYIIVFTPMSKKCYLKAKFLCFYQFFPQFCVSENVFSLVFQELYYRVCLLVLLVPFSLVKTNTIIWLFAIRNLDTKMLKMFCFGCFWICVPSIKIFTRFYFQIKPEDDGSKSEDEDMAAIMAEFDLDNPFPGQSLPVSQQQQAQTAMPTRWLFNMHHFLFGDFIANHAWLYITRNEEWVNAAFCSRYKQQSQSSIVYCPLIWDN